MAQTGDKPYDAVIANMGVKVPDTCVICDDWVFAGWRMLHGECECKCGAIYQIRPTTELEWDDVPYHKMKEEYIEACRAMYAEVNTIDGFGEWLEDNPEYKP